MSTAPRVAPGSLAGRWCFHPAHTGYDCTPASKSTHQSTHERTDAANTRLLAGCAIDIVRPGRRARSRSRSIGVAIVMRAQRLAPALLSAALGFARSVHTHQPGCGAG